MKAEELTLGSWVRLRYKKYDTGEEVVKDFQVSELRRRYKECPHVDAWSVEDGNMSDVERLEGIPLTPEILEKNGFLRTPAIGERMCADDNYEIWVDFKKNKYWLNIKVSNDNKKENPVHYYEGYHSSLHELQMALKLCKIDKEIVL